MRNIINGIFTILLLLCGSVTLRADEGMWLVNAINSALEKKMQERGLELSAGEIYNADAPGTALCDAVVSLDFGCTGSIISDNGLLITNHHCAYSDVFNLSTPQKNYLEEGFWAFTDMEEIPIPGKRVLLLKKVIDVTQEVEAMLSEAEREGRPLGTRKLGYLMEKKYSGSEGLEAWFSPMWKGSRYYISLYKVYTDIRLVASPPVCSAAFGGDIDNWEWPQHKCDFAMYRIYTAPDGSPAGYKEDNVPLKPLKSLRISLDGYKPGDFTMIIGFPGRTDRYASSFSVDYDCRVELPVSNEIRGSQMKIVKGWMDRDPEIRLKYSDYFFGLSNVQELNEGQVQCYRRFGTVDSKRAQECELREWIGADPQRALLWQDIPDGLENAYKDSEGIRRSAVLFRETLVRGMRLSRYATRISSLRKDRDSLKAEARLKEVLEKTAEEAFSQLDMRVEKDLFRYAFTTYCSRIGQEWLGEYQRSLISENGKAAGGKRLGEIADSLWEASFLTGPERFKAFAERHPSVAECCSDPLLKFLGDVSIVQFNQRRDIAEGGRHIPDLEKMYTRALYQMRLEKGMAQYPDANSTMRITYGTVGTVEPFDGV
ncbi:MAG: S46 family peptidase, partial [Candidatus Cryptobacteroides sp.]